MRLLLIAALTMCAPAAGAAQTPMKTKTPAAVVAALVRFTAPKGWTVSEYSNSEGADSVVRFENLSDAITLKVYGAPGSAYPTMDAFLRGPAATSQGQAPVVAGIVTVAGRKLTLYRRRFPVNIPDPHGPLVPLMLGSEWFAILPAKGKRFVVLSCLRESPVPDAEASAEKVWAAFLKTVKPR
jgi:hypothetical protein